MRGDRMSLSFAIALVLGPAIFLSILAYEGALADDPSPFDDEPSHHRHLPWAEPLRFCTFIDEENQIQAKAGPCNIGQDVPNERKTPARREFCMGNENGTFDFVMCSQEAGKEPEARDGVRSTLPNTLCLRWEFNGHYTAVVCDSLEDLRIVDRKHVPSPGICYTARPGSFWGPYSKPGSDEARSACGQQEEITRLLDRATPSANLTTIKLADEPANWTGTTRCSKDFCDWANSPGEIEGRCYDGNPSTNCTPDSVLKYTAPFECNLCLEDCKFYPDRDHIERHCEEVATKEDFTFKVLMGAGGGLLFLTILCGIYCDRRRKGHPLGKAEPLSMMEKKQTHLGGPRVLVMPSYDGATDLGTVSNLSLTASQRDAPEIQITSPLPSLSSNRSATEQYILPRCPPATRKQEFCAADFSSSTTPAVETYDSPLIPGSIPSAKKLDGVHAMERPELTRFRSECQLVMPPASSSRD